ncbi:MAG: hypothetical protein PHS92_01690 [Candidatus Gracilibacteria bacterium]|nr:hypothetical protein [Candidatus Gracilibacteria bacterium]
MCKKEGKVLTIYEIGNILDPDFKKGNEKNISSVYKIIYRLKALNMIIPIKNSLYFINNRKSFRDIDIIDSFYWQILKKVIADNTGNDYFIGNLKAIELNLKDYSIPEEIIIYCRDFEKTISLTSKNKIIFKTLAGGKKNPKNSIYPKIKAFTKKTIIDKLSFVVANEELSLLDSLLIRNNMKKIDTYLIDKFLNKYQKFLSREIMGKLVSLKYITSINRLREISKANGNNILYGYCLDIIKNEGGNCFLTVLK